jgi:hypothetical protein
MNMGYIGIFWYIDDRDEIEHMKFPLKDEMTKPANANSPFITPEISHPMLWVVSRLKLGIDKDYTYYPRGRVNYNINKGVFEIDMDVCLHNKYGFLRELYRVFQLENRNATIIAPMETNKHGGNSAKEGHYRCHLCS